MANVKRVKHGSIHTLFPRYLSINAAVNPESFWYVRAVGSDSQTFINSDPRRLGAGIRLDAIYVLTDQQEVGGEFC